MNDHSLDDPEPEELEEPEDPEEVEEVDELEPPLSLFFASDFDELSLPLLVLLG